MKINLKRSLQLAVLLVSVAGMQAFGLASKPLVDLDASKLTEGPLSVWANSGSLKGTFKSELGMPQVKVVDGVKAVEFSGKEAMLADFKAPQSIVGDKPWTVIIRVYGKNISGERTLLSWANRPDNCIEIEYGEAVQWGALGTWSQNVSGWEYNVPPAGKWHTLIYTYQGGPNGEFQAWYDGNLCVSKKFTLATKPDRPFVLGASMLGDPAEKPSYVHQVEAAISSLQVYDRGISTVEAWNICGFTSAYMVSPKTGSLINDITTNLIWAAGNPSVAGYDVYVGTDKATVEAANNKLPAGKASDWKTVYKGRKAVSDTSFGPLPLRLGSTYYWKIDQVDASGAVIQPGSVAKFTAENGNAADPEPADSYIFVEGGKHELKWKPGKYAVKQNVYIADSLAEVMAKRKPAFANLPTTVTSVKLPIENPVLGKTYYWRVESINGNGLGVSKGDVWSFRTVSKKLKVYLQSGQSNSVGCSMVTGIPDKYRGFNKNVIIFVRGESKVGPNAYGWAYLKEGLGSSFGDKDGKGCFGPELTFGYDMAPSDPTQVIAILKCAWGGKTLGGNYRPPSAGGQTGELYTDLVKAIHEGLDKLDPAFDPEIVGMIWMQGESDSGDQKMSEDYAKNLTYFINDIRAEVKKPNMPFVFGQIAKAPAWEPRGGMIRDAQLKVSQTVPYTATFSTEGYGMADPWHYDTAGMLSLGERFASAMKKLVK